MVSTLYSFSPPQAGNSLAREVTIRALAKNVRDFRGLLKYQRDLPCSL